MHLRNIALPIAKEALLLANCCQCANDAPAPGGLFEGSSLQAPSCLQQELDPVQRRRQRLPCEADNAFTMMACSRLLFCRAEVCALEQPWTLSSAQAVSSDFLHVETKAHRQYHQERDRCYRVDRGDAPTPCIPMRH